MFKNPEKFDPDRFADGNEYPNMSYIPFSAGPRNCVGQRFALMEIKIMLAHLVYNFRIETHRQMEDNKTVFEALSKLVLFVINFNDLL